MLLVNPAPLRTDTSNTKRPAGFRGYLTPTVCVIQHDRGKWGPGPKTRRDKLCFGSPLVEAVKTQHRLGNKVNKDAPVQLQEQQQDSVLSHICSFESDVVGGERNNRQN